MDKLVHAIPEMYRYIGNPLGHDLPKTPGDAAEFACAGPKLEAKNYPLVKYWHKESFNPDVALRKYKSQVRDGKLISKVYLFCENENGDPISDADLKNVKEDIRVMFTGLPEPYPKTFCFVTWPQRKQIYDVVYSKWPFLRLCSNDWKIKHICTQLYPQWNPVKSNETNVKSEDQGKYYFFAHAVPLSCIYLVENIVTTSVNKGKKRASTEAPSGGSSQVHKKTKVSAMTSGSMPIKEKDDNPASPSNQVSQDDKNAGDE